MCRGYFIGQVNHLWGDLPLTKEKQEKALTLFRVRAGHNIPQCGLFSEVSGDAFHRGQKAE